MKENNQVPLDTETIYDYFEEKDRSNTFSDDEIDEYIKNCMSQEVVDCMNYFYGDTVSWGDRFFSGELIDLFDKVEEFISKRE